MDEGKDPQIRPENQEASSLRQARRLRQDLRKWRVECASCLVSLAPTTLVVLHFEISDGQQSFLKSSFVHCYSILLFAIHLDLTPHSFIHAIRK